MPGDQGLATPYTTLPAPQRLEQPGHPLDDLAINQADGQRPQAGWDPRCCRQHGWQQRQQPLRPFGQEGFAQRRSQTAELVVGGLVRGGEDALLVSPQKASPPAAAVRDEGIADESDQYGKGAFAGVRPTPQASEEVVEMVSVGQPGPQV